MSRAVGYLLTWTTYGTWMRGDARGYVGETLQPDGSVLPRVNEPGKNYSADDSLTLTTDLARLKNRPVLLGQSEATVVAEALVELSRRRAYMIRSAAVMSDHVHVAMDAEPEEARWAIRRFKSITAVRLSQRFGSPSGRWWTREGSKRIKESRSAYEAAIRYVANQSGKLAEVVDNQVVPRGD